MKKVRIRIKRRAGSEDLPLPMYMTPGAAGMDLYADVEKEMVIPPGEIRFVSTGIHIELPEGFEAQIRPRSGLALKYGVTLVNTPGTIDSDYVGLINLIIINLGKEPFAIKRGDRVAQMVINEVARAEFEISDELKATVRNPAGFGTTGL